MFGKPRDIHDSDTIDASAFDEFFGDESAAEQGVEILELRDRVHQVEIQISSQFTSLATYAQIAHEQVELARAEAKATTERSEQRLTSLIERERTDRLESSPNAAFEGSPDIELRLDALEEMVGRIQQGLDDCRAQQKDLALAIRTIFNRYATRPVAPAEGDAATEPGTFPAPSVPAPIAERTTFPAPTCPSSADEPAAFAAPTPATSAERSSVGSDHGFDGPIRGLALNG